MAWRRNLQVSSVGTSAERLGVGADHDGGRAAGAKGAATEETRKGLRLRILPGTGCHRAGPPSKSGARAGGGRSDDFTQSNCGGTEAELATSATTCLHPQPPSRAYICVRNQPLFLVGGGAHQGDQHQDWLESSKPTLLCSLLSDLPTLFGCQFVRARLSAFLSTEATTGNSSRVLALVIRLVRNFTRRDINDQLGAFVYVPWALGLAGSVRHHPSLLHVGADRPSAAGFKLRHYPAVGR